MDKDIKILKRLIELYRKYPNSINHIELEEIQAIDKLIKYYEGGTNEQK